MRHAPKQDLSDRPLFIVWRAARGTLPGFMPDGMEGRWDHRPGPPDPLMADPDAHEGAHAIAIRTGRIEHRDDGASAEVWEVHPADGNYDPDPANRLPLW